MPIKWLLTTLAALAATLISIASRASISVTEVYEMGDGHRLVQISSTDHPELLGADRIFWGKGSDLYQLDLTFESESDTARLMEFRANTNPDTHEIFLDRSSASASCGERKKLLKKIDAKTLDQEIQSGKIHIYYIPDVKEPAYLFQVPGKNEFVSVKESPFNIGQIYEVRIGPLGHMKKVELEYGGRKREGLIRFKSGGGIYIPTAIDLFSKAAKDRGQPSLMRTKMALMETLIKPRLTAKNLSAAGMKSVSLPQLRTPCDL